LLLKTVPSLKFAKMDSDANDVNRKYLQERFIPNIKLFTMNNKETPIKCENRTSSGILKFIHSNCTTKFELNDFLPQAQLLDTIPKELATLKEYLSDCKSLLSAEEEQQISQVTSPLEQSLFSDFVQLKKEYQIFKTSEAILRLEKIAKEKEKSVLKNIIRIKTEEEFSTLTTQFKDRPTLIFYASSQSTEHQSMVSLLSEDYPEILWLKIHIEDLYLRQFEIKHLPALFLNGQEIILEEQSLRVTLSQLKRKVEV